MMKKHLWLAIALVAGSTVGLATTSTSATLRDLQPTNTPGIQKKHQQFDLFVGTASRNYTCRTSPDKNVNATDFVVGSPVIFEFGGKSGEVKTPEGKKVKCTIVRVENAGPQ